jgi:hypothetical protein
MLDGCSHMLHAPGVISFPLWRPHQGALELRLPDLSGDGRLRYLGAAESASTGGQEWQEAGRYWAGTVEVAFVPAVAPVGAVALPQRHTVSLLESRYGTRFNTRPLIVLFAWAPFGGIIQITYPDDRDHDHQLDQGKPTLQGIVSHR